MKFNNLPFVLNDNCTTTETILRNLSKNHQYITGNQRSLMTCTLYITSPYKGDIV